METIDLRLLIMSGEEIMSRQRHFRLKAAVLFFFSKISPALDDTESTQAQRKGGTVTGISIQLA